MNVVTTLLKKLSSYTTHSVFIACQLSLFVSGMVCLAADLCTLPAVDHRFLSVLAAVSFSLLSLLGGLSCGVIVLKVLERRKTRALIRHVTEAEFNDIVKSRKPLGLFWYRNESGYYCGCDNTDGFALVSTFLSFEGVTLWLTLDCDASSDGCDRYL